MTDDVIYRYWCDEFQRWCKCKGSIYHDRLESLKSEYNAYHIDTDYWRGIKYAIEIMEKVVD